MSTPDALPFLKAMMRRMIIWGPVIIAILGVVGAVGAIVDGEYIGAGVLLAASAVAVAVMAYAYDKVT